MSDHNNRHDLFKTFLKPEARKILNNLNNYKVRGIKLQPSICRYCNQEIKRPVLPLILWNEDEEHYMEFHVDCIIKKERLEEFIEFINNFDYTYEIDNS